MVVVFKDFQGVGFAIAFQWLLRESHGRQLETQTRQWKDIETLKEPRERFDGTEAQLLTIEAVADLLGIESHHARKLIAAGLIPSVKLSPRIVRVPRWLLVRKLEEMAGLANPRKERP